MAGVGLLYVSYQARRHGQIEWEFTLSHLGVASLVSGVVGVFYELTLDRARYNEAVESLSLLGSTDSPAKLRGALLSLLPTHAPEVDKVPGMSELHSNMRGHIERIVDKTRALEQEGRARLVLIRFVEKLLKYSADAASTLSPSGGLLSLPVSATVLAAEILSEQMGAMTKGDSYDVISDFSTWQSRELAVFREKIRAVVTKGVRVRRVFAHFGYDAVRMSETIAKEILREHWEVAKEFPEYELAVSVHSYEHVGTFTCGGAPISFRVPNGDLSQMTVLRSHPEGFGKCWAEAIKSRRSGPGDLKATRVVEFNAFLQEVADKDSTWWSRFVGPSERVRDTARGG
jgi:hypothetical protein